MDAELPLIPPMPHSRRPLATRGTRLCNHRKAMSRQLLERAPTMACQAPSRPAQLVRPNRMQFGRKRCGRGCRPAPVNRFRDRTIRV